MSFNEERMQVLKMLEEGKITAEEAAKLLAALEIGAKKEEGSKSGPSARRARWLRIRVTDEKTGKSKVNLTLPLGMVNAAMKMSARFAPEMHDMNVDEILEAIRTGNEGKIVDVQDSEDGEHVEIFME